MPGSIADTSTTTATEQAIVARLREGDERAFETLVAQNYGTMIAVAQHYVSSRAVAEEVVQETWVGVLKGLDRFQGRSSLRTWIMSILVNIAKTRGVRESRSVPYSALGAGPDDPAVDPERFRSSDEGFPGHWRAYPSDWNARPDQRLLGQETMGVVKAAISELPEGQRAVITMRDVAGCTPQEVCTALAISDGNQRVLLHRARSRVRAALEAHLDG
jgi:RNA polymerase sigma-70 factor, ECF subfamily